MKQIHGSETFPLGSRTGVAARMQLALKDQINPQGKLPKSLTRWNPVLPLKKSRKGSLSRQVLSTSLEGGLN